MTAGSEEGNQTGSLDDAASALEDLADFVRQMASLLAAVVEDGRFIPAELREDVLAAWTEAEADLRALARSLDPQQEPDHVANLQRHGLTGNSLRAKLHAWRRSFFAFGRRMNRRWLREVLRIGDVILGSLVDSMTLGAAGKEFKELVEHLLGSTANDPDKMKRSKQEA